MITVRRSSERGHAQHGWLDSRHTFSFADYYDPAHMGFRTLRVINEDRVQPGRGFGVHSHEDMEIVSYVLEGALQHRDSMGNGAVLRPGEVQRMSAGTGVTHSEFNASNSEIVHFLQIWILPERKGLTPSYEQKTFRSDVRRNELILAASRDGRLGSVVVHQDANLYLARLDAGNRIELELPPSRAAWVQVVRGSVALRDEKLAAGDGAALSGEKSVSLTAAEDAEALVFDLT
ncbi:MAG TPA: quercetin 2,3-dioxygenase [Deltaproteobacteria bacterium]|jgi:redox-sensitive bicupin YhaK (pirin superfamily)|nr:quercetin 2,3-dioxygenase [Deltaproteobacteria bacterium]